MEESSSQLHWFAIRCGWRSRDFRHPHHIRCTAV